MQLSVESEHAKQTKWRLKEGLDYIWKGTLQSDAATNVLSAIHLVESSAMQWGMWVPSQMCGEPPQKAKNRCYGVW